jgi:putative Holliday junction resolvase
VGEKRVGVAVTDPLGLTAQPLTVIPRKPHGQFLESISDLVRQKEAELVILGLPRRTDGAIGPEAQRILSLAYELRNRQGLVVDTFDERLTTAMAHRVFDEAGMNKKDRREVVDMTAAALILEGYLAKRSHSPDSLKPGPSDAGEA